MAKMITVKGYTCDNGHKFLSPWTRYFEDTGYEQWCPCKCNDGTQCYGDIWKTDIEMTEKEYEIHCERAELRAMSMYYCL